MSDTTHVETPLSDGSAHSAPSQASNVPTPPIPEEILDEWRWIFQAREEGLFDQYPGEHVAVYQQKIWGSSLDAKLLREHVALKYQIDPKRLVIVYIDRW